MPKVYELAEEINYPSRIIGAESGVDRGRARRVAAGLLRLDRRDRRRQIVVARRPRLRPGERAPPIAPCRAEELWSPGRFELVRRTCGATSRTFSDGTLDDNEIILLRRLKGNGRSHAYANDRPVVIATLKQIGDLLVDIHGQRETESLLHPAYQLQLLDAYGHLEEPRRKYATLAERVRELRRRRNTLSTERQQRQRELSLLRFERDELDEANLSQARSPNWAANANGWGTRRICKRLLRSLRVSCTTKTARLSSGWETTARSAIVGSPDPSLEEVVRRLEGLHAEVQDLADVLRHLGQRWEADPERLDEVEHRLQFLRRLESKYRRSLDDLIVYRAGLDEQEKLLAATGRRSGTHRRGAGGSVWTAAGGGGGSEQTTAARCRSPGERDPETVCRPRHGRARWRRIWRRTPRRLPDSKRRTHRGPISSN